MFGGTAIMGPYTVTWDTMPLGIMVGEEGVPTYLHRYSTKLIDNTDAKGRQILGGTYLGPNVRARMRCIEYKAGPIAALWPFGANGKSGQVGRDVYDLAKILVFTAVLGTPAVATPASRTSNKTLLAPDFDVQLQFGPMVREVPLEFLCMLYDATGDAFYVDT